MQKRIAIQISGKVQGVFFRASTKEYADQLGVKGFVRNEPNGDVYVEAEGVEETLRSFEAWCKQGPRLARVDRVDVKAMEWIGFTDFVISR